MPESHLSKFVAGIIGKSHGRFERHTGGDRELEVGSSQSHALAFYAAITSCISSPSMLNYLSLQRVGLYEAMCDIV